MAADFGVHPGITRKDGVECCYVCDCPFVSPEGVARSDVVAYFASLVPVDDRPCVPTPAVRRRQRLMPLINAWYVLLILATQGPRVLYHRFCWWLFGPEWRSNCWLCDGSGRLMVIPVAAYPSSSSPAPCDSTHLSRCGEPGDDGLPVRRIEVNCSSCNGFHD